MEARAESLQAGATYPLTVEVPPPVEGRNRWTAFFRFFLMPDEYPPFTLRV